MLPVRFKDITKSLAGLVNLRAGIQSCYFEKMNLNSDNSLV